MIVIADAGSTTTEWRILKGEKVEQLKTNGINIQSDSVEGFVREVASQFDKHAKIDTLYFYGAGVLNSKRDSGTLHEAFNSQLTVDKVIAESDMLGAARSLCLDQKGWVGILGTGSNLSFYNGRDITERIPPLGFILGDEGSGSYLGKALIRDYLRGKTPDDISERLEKRFGITEEIVMKEIYKGSTKQYLNSFSRFLFQNVNHPYIYRLVYNSFEEFFKLLDGKSVDVIHFTGSIAFFFGNILRQVGNDLGIRVGNISESPIAGLLLYHKKYVGY